MEAVAGWVGVWPVVVEFAAVDFEVLFAELVDDELLEERTLIPVEDWGTDVDDIGFIVFVFY